MSIKVKLTRQGVRDLNDSKHNGRTSILPPKHRHFFLPSRQVSTTWVRDDNGQGYEVPVYGRQCMHCDKVQYD